MTRRATLTLLKLLALAALGAALAGAPGPPRPLPRLRIYVFDASLSVRAAAGHAGAVPTLELALDLAARDARRLGPQDRFASVVFAGDVRVVESEIPRAAEAADPHRTDAAAALQAALALARPDRASEIVLFSDGRFGPEAEALVRGRGVPVLTVPLGAAEPDDARIAALDAPPQVEPGRPFEARVTVVSSKEAEGTLRLAGQERPVRLLAGGRHEFVFSDLRIADERELTAEIAVADAVPENNRWPFLVAPADRRPRLLVLSGFPESPAAAALGTAVRAERGGPPEAFDAVLVEELRADQLDAAALRRYVLDGGTLLTMGGASAYGAGGWAATPLEEVLPVWAFPRDDLAVAIALDASGSMAQPGRMEAARRRLLEAAAFLSERDLLALVTFGSRIERVYGPGPAGARERLEAELKKVKPDGPTHVVRAARAAAEALRAAAVPARLLILVTDGDTQEEAALQEAAFAELEREGIACHAVVTAEQHRLHGVRVVRADGVDAIAGPLKEIFARARRLTVENPADGPVRRANRTDLREGAELLAAVDGSPLLATRRVGRGRTGAYTSALTGEWGGRAEHVARLWQALRPDVAGVPASARFDGADVRVVWKAAGGVEGGIVWSQGARRGSARLVLREPDRVEASLQAPAPGRLEIAGPTRLSFVVPYSPELASVGRDDAALRRLAESTGGRHNDLEGWASPERSGAAPAPALYAAAALLLFVLEAVLAVVWK